MKITFYQSSNVLIEDKDTKIFCDPWIEDGEHLGSWNHYPPLKFNYNVFKDVDYIYISHIHEDHTSHKTLRKIPKHIPILLYNFEEKFLKKSLERDGFEVIELDPFQEFQAKDIKVNIIPCAPCDPEVCGSFFGCGVMEKRYRMTVIDSMAVFTNGDKTIVNTNDCPYDIAKEAVQMIKDKYGTIDLLMTGYMGAGPYPQCYVMGHQEKYAESVKKKNTFLEKSANYVDVLEPKMTMPFAGQYVLSGKLTGLNEYRGVPNYWETSSFFRRRCPKTDLLFLNAHQWYDLETNTMSKDYDIVDDVELKEYQKNILRKRKMDYEINYTEGNIAGRLVQSYLNMERKRKEIEYNSDTVVYIEPLDEDWIIRVTMNGEGVSVVSDIMDKKFIVFQLDSRLLGMILNRKTMWQVAEWGSHMKFYRINNEFDRGIHYCMNFFHV